MLKYYLGKSDPYEYCLSKSFKVSHIKCPEVSKKYKSVCPYMYVLYILNTTDHQPGWLSDQILSISPIIKIHAFFFLMWSPIQNNLKMCYFSSDAVTDL